MKRVMLYNRHDSFYDLKSLTTQTDFYVISSFTLSHEHPFPVSLQRNGKSAAVKRDFTCSEAQEISGC